MAKTACLRLMLTIGCLYHVSGIADFTGFIQVQNHYICYFYTLFSSVCKTEIYFAVILMLLFFLALFGLYICIL